MVMTSMETQGCSHFFQGKEVQWTINVVRMTHAGPVSQRIKEFLLGTANDPMRLRHGGELHQIEASTGAVVDLGGQLSVQVLGRVSLPCNVLQKGFRRGRVYPLKA